MKVELIPKSATELLEEDANAPEREVLGKELFPEPYANIFLCARKKSGKTTVLYNILKHCTDKRTKVICFASTVYKDKQWLRIADHLRKQGVEFEGHMSIFDNQTGENIVERIINGYKEESEQRMMRQKIKEREAAKREEEKEREKEEKKKRKRSTQYKYNEEYMDEDMVERMKYALHSAVKRRRLVNPILNEFTTVVDAANEDFCLFEPDDKDHNAIEQEMERAFAGSNRIYECREQALIDQLNDDETPHVLENGDVAIGDQVLSSEKASLTKVAKIVFIFDDVSNELFNKHIAQLLKTNRHYLAKVILSSQYVQDLAPSSRKQIDYWLLFGGHSVDKLEIIHRDCDTRLPFNKFVELYKKITSEPYTFLLIDVAEDGYRKNFDEDFIPVDKNLLSEARKPLAEQMDQNDYDIDEDEDEDEYEYDSDEDKRT